MLSFIEGIKVAAERNGSGPALISGNRVINYAELLEAVARISNHLADRGLKPNTKLFINIADPDFRLIVTMAAMYAGLIPFALLDIAELGDAVDHDIVIGAAVLRVPDLVPDIMIDQSVLAGRLSDPVLRELPSRADDEILFIASTTGTTGRRKLVAELVGSFRKKEAMRKLVPGVGETGTPLPSRLTSEDRVVSTLGDVSKYGMNLSLHILAAGGTHVRVLNDTTETLKLINLFGVNYLITTPAALELFMDKMDDAKIRCQTVKRIRLTGSLFHRALLARIEQHFDALVGIGYGTSELGRISSGATSSATYKPGFVGELHPEIKLITAGSREEPAPLVVLNNAELNLPYYSGGKLSFFDEKFYTLPDLGFVEDGNLYLVGRDDEVYNLDGNKHAYSILDAALHAIPGVRDVGMVGGSAIGEVGDLIVAVAGEPDVDREVLVAAMLKAMKAPARVAPRIRLFLLDRVPRNSLGKVDRQAIVEAYRQQAVAV